MLNLRTVGGRCARGDGGRAAGGRTGLWDAMRPDVRGAGCGRIRRVVLMAALGAVVVALGAPPTTAQDEFQGDDVGPPLPDLLVDSLTEEFAQDGAQLLLAVNVLNAAAGEADATSVTAEAAGWETGEEPMSALGPQEDAVVVLTFEVPDDARGQEALFRVEVDPADAVTEESENNNVGRVAVEVPSGDAGGDPDRGEQQEDPDGGGGQEDPEDGEESGEGPSDRSVDPLDVLRGVAAAVLPAIPVAALIVLAAAVAVVAVRALRDRVRPPPNVRMEAHAAPPPDLRVQEVDDRRTVTVRIEPRRDAGDTTLEEVSE